MFLNFCGNPDVSTSYDLIINNRALIFSQLEGKNEEVVNLRSQIISLEDRVRELEQYQTMEITSQSAKWSEFERLAESMRTLSHTMAQSSTSPLGGTRSSPRPMHF